MLAMLSEKPLAIVNVAVFNIQITPQQHFTISTSQSLTRRTEFRRSMAYSQITPQQHLTTTTSHPLQMPNINKTA